MKVLFAESTFWDTRQDFQKRYEAKILRAAKACRRLLPQIPHDVTFVVQANNYESMPEYGCGAYTKNSRLIIITIDPGLPYGEEIQLRYVRESVFHELNHAARFEQGIWHDDFIDRCILEGLATVFERDYAGAEPLYGEYDSEACRAWLDEIKENFTEEKNYEYMFRHKDGRRWIGYKVGTYIADEAIKRSGKSIMNLTACSCQEIKELAQINT